MFDTGSAVRLLETDPDLGARLDPRELEDAKRRLVVPVDRLDPGEWNPGTVPDADTQLGIMVIEGLLTRDVEIAETTCAELIGPGEILRPWDHLGAGASIPAEVEWHVLLPSKLALLDRRLLAMLTAWPDVMTAIVARAVTRAQTLAVSLAISCITGLKVRLHVLLWHLADRFGTVGREGVSLPLPLTHQTIGRLVGASRPSVSTALKELEDDGSISKRMGGGFVIHGDPPEVAKLMADRKAAMRASTRGG